MTERKQYVCWKEGCGQPFLWGPKDPATGKCIRLTLDRHLHVCTAQAKTIDSNKVEVKEKSMNDQEFVQKTVAKYEEKRQTEAERREEMIRMHDENITAWTNQTAATMRLAAAIEEQNRMMNKR